MKLFDSELKIMEVLWEHGPTTAAEIAKILKDAIGWNRNTTYTVIKKCAQKGALERRDPKFLCVPLVTQSEAQAYETHELINRMFHGSRMQFLSAMVQDETLSEDELAELRALIDERT